MNALCPRFRFQPSLKLIAAVASFHSCAMGEVLDSSARKVLAKNEKDKVEGPGSRTVLAAAKAEDEKSQLRHLWKEWNAFLAMLGRKNCFEGVQRSELEDDMPSTNAIKHAILKFSHDWDDIHRLVTKKHLMNVMKSGFPNTDWNVVNSSKHHWGFCGVSEKQLCRMNPSCENTFIAADTQFEPTSSDVLQVLHAFASNASQKFESECALPVGIVSSACHLLNEIVQLSGCPKNSAVPLSKSHSPKTELSDDTKFSDQKTWTCPECTCVNLIQNRKCRECGTLQKLVEPGDWKCPTCAFANFRRNKKCRACLQPRPVNDEDLMPGDWKCPKCKFINYKKNDQCWSCFATRSKDGVNQSEPWAGWKLEISGKTDDEKNIKSTVKMAAKCNNEDIGKFDSVLVMGRKFKVDGSEEAGGIFKPSKTYGDKDAAMEEEVKIEFSDAIDKELSDMLCDCRAALMKTSAKDAVPGGFSNPGGNQEITSKRASIKGRQGMGKNYKWGRSELMISNSNNHKEELSSIGDRREKRVGRMVKRTEVNGSHFEVSLVGDRYGKYNFLHHDKKKLKTKIEIRSTKRGSVLERKR